MAVSLVVVVVIAIVVPLLYLVLLPAGKRRCAGRFPPSPPWGLPLLGHLHLLGALPHRALRSLAAAHGPVLLLRLGRVPVVVVSSAAAAEEVMRSRDLEFASRPRSAVAERLLYGRDVAFAPYGEYWRQTRRICVVHLLSARRVLSFRRVREEEAAALVGRVRAAALAPGARGAVDLIEHLIAYSNSVVSRAVFGDESARGLYGDVDRGRTLRKLFDDFVQLKETLRLHPPLPLLVPHEPPADTKILGYNIPAHTRIVVNAWTIGHDRATWGEHAEEFIPERFLESGLDYKGQDFVLVPFGAGRRGCPGVGFAVLAMEMALASLLYNFDWETRVVDRRSEFRTSSLDMSETNGLSVRLKYGLPLVAKSRFP